MKRFIKAVHSFFKRIFICRMAYLFLCGHWILFLIALYQRGRFYLFYHFAFEPLLVQILSVINIPAVFLGILLSTIFGVVLDIIFTLIYKLILFVLPESALLNFQLSDEISSTIAYFFIYSVFFLLISLQWMLIGYALNKLMKYWRGKQSM